MCDYHFELLYAIMLCDLVLPGHGIHMSRVQVSWSVRNCKF